MTRAYNMKLILFFVFAFFLVGVLTIPTSLAQDAVPSWIKNNAGWWAENKIDDLEVREYYRHVYLKNMMERYLNKF